MDDAVRDYIDAIGPEHRPLFDRLHRLVLEAHPDAAVVLSYKIPTYKVGSRRLFLDLRLGPWPRRWLHRPPPQAQDQHGDDSAPAQRRRGHHRRRVARSGTRRPRRLIRTHRHSPAPTI